MLQWCSVKVLMTTVNNCQFDQISVHFIECYFNCCCCCCGSQFLLKVIFQRKYYFLSNYSVVLMWENFNNNLPFSIKILQLTCLSSFDWVDWRYLIYFLNRKMVSYLKIRWDHEKRNVQCSCENCNRLNNFWCWDWSNSYVSLSVSRVWHFFEYWE